MADEIAREFNLNCSESERIIRFLVDRVAENLVNDERVYFRGFGAFHRDYRPEKKYRDPRTGKIKTRAGYFDIDFRGAKGLLQRLNKKK